MKIIILDKKKRIKKNLSGDMCGWEKCGKDILVIKNEKLFFFKKILLTLLVI